ncbi:MAG: DUF4157 domain-containing protein [Anaerolineaceae bacterium]|nr:DUF4157 domain-containing protein [Anaerolineaceae bacterium]
MSEPASERIDKEIKKTLGPESVGPGQIELQPFELPAPHREAVVNPAGDRPDPTDGQAAFLSDTRLSSRREAGLRQRFIESLQQHFGNRHVQRVLAERNKLDLQRQSSDGSLQAGRQSTDQIAHQRAGGQPLPSPVQDQMETAFGTDFSQVRLHTGPEAQALSQALAARAFTSGSDIWLANANDANDASLLAHELTHVVQQGGQPPAGGQPLQVSQPADASEQQAEQVAGLLSQPEIAENNLEPAKPTDAVPAFQREEQTNAPVKPTLTPEQKVVVNQDVENIVTILTAGDPDPEQQAAIIRTFRNYQQLDTDYQNSSGFTGSAYLDYFLVRLKIATVVHSRIWPLESETVNAFDDLWYRLTDNSLAEYKTILASSQTEHTAGPETKDVESFTQTMGKQESMGVWGMLKGMGQGLAGLSDAGAKALTKAMRGAGVDVADPASISDWLGQQYDISGNFMFGQDWQKKDNLALGMNAADIGTKGGGVIWNLVMLGSGKAASADAKAALLALGVAGNLDAIDKCTTNIANIIGRLQKGGKLNPSDLLSDPDFISESAKLAANIYGVVSAGAATDEELSNSVRLALSTTGRILDSGQAVALVNKLYAISASNLDPDAKNKASADAVVELIQVSVNIVENASPEKEEVSGIDEGTGGKTTTQNQPPETQAAVAAKPIKSESENISGKSLELDKTGTPQQSDLEGPSKVESGLDLDKSGKPQQTGLDQTYGMIPEEQVSAETTPTALHSDAETEFPRQNELTESEMQARASQNAPESGRAVGSPGTAGFGESESRSGMHLREYDAAEMAPELRIRKDYSPEYGGYLRSVEFDVPAKTGNFGTRPDKFNKDEALKPISVEHPKGQDLNKSDYELGHAAAQQLSGGDPDVARALMVTTNMWPMKGLGSEGINQGQYKEFEDDYIALKAEHPDSEVHIRVEAIVSETPRFITGSTSRKVLAPEAFVITVTVTSPDGSLETFNMRINN